MNAGLPVVVEKFTRGHHPRSFQNIRVMELKQI